MLLLQLSCLLLLHSNLLLFAEFPHLFALLKQYLQLNFHFLDFKLHFCHIGLLLSGFQIDLLLFLFGFFHEFIYLQTLDFELMIRIFHFLSQLHLLLVTLLHLTLNSLCFLNPHLISSHLSLNILLPFQNRLDPIILKHIHHEFPITLAAQATLLSRLIIKFNRLGKGSL